MREPQVANGDAGITELHNSGEAFEKAWREWRVGDDVPRWEAYIPRPGNPDSANLISFILQLDIESRPTRPGCRHCSASAARASSPSGGRCRAGRRRPASLIRWDYQHRWKHGRRPRRQEYQSAFPQHAVALQDLNPRWNCPACRKKGIPLEDETAETLSCPYCNDGFMLSDMLPPLPKEQRVTEADAIAADPTGLDLRDYELFDQLGAGGMGAVYRGRDPSLGRDLAVKVMLPDLGRDAEIQGRFIREARITGSAPASRHRSGPQSGPAPRRPTVLHDEAGPWAHPREYSRRQCKGQLRRSHQAAGNLRESVPGRRLRPQQARHSPRSEAGEHHGGPVR